MCKFFKAVILFAGLLFLNICNGEEATCEKVVQSNNQQVNLLGRYPTTLVEGCTDSAKARQWEFSKEDIYQLSEFTFKVGDELEIMTGLADVGIGHCADGAVWALVVPRQDGIVKSSVSATPEIIDHLWLRFHPAEISNLFPKKTVSGSGNKKLWARMQKIATMKMRSSWQASGRAMIPPPEKMTVDYENEIPKRRFFSVNLEAGTAKYYSNFEDRIVKQDQPFSKEQAGEAFDKLWQEYDRNYAMFAIKPDVDWDALGRQYRSKAIDCDTAYEFALVCTEMLGHLRDLHIWVSVDGVDLPVFNRPRERNANFSARELIVGKIEKAGDNISWGIAEDKVGYIAIDSWSGDVDEKFEVIIEEMRDTRGLILDVRLNGGGGEPLAQNVAGRFADKTYTYAYSQVRKGPKHSDLSSKQARGFETRGPWRYDRPVIVLMGQLCMSSNESFISMMDQCPQVTTMGDRSCGSSGNPKFIELPAKISISLPQWIDLLPDGRLLEERGIEPDVKFPTKAEYFEGDRDDLLKAAIEKMSKEPLPKEAIAGLDFKTMKPLVVEVFPPNGDENVDPNCEIRIRFDRPMEPEMAELDWEMGEYKNFRYMRYDANSYEFKLGFVLKAGCKHQIEINANNADTFRDMEGNASRRYKWDFETRASSQPESGSIPKLVSVEPKTGSTSAAISEVHLKFDQPMQPYQCDFNINFGSWSDRYGILFSAVGCSFDQSELFLPLVLPPDWQGKIEFSQIMGVNGQKADTVVLDFKTNKELLGSEIQKRIEKSKNGKMLKSLVTKMICARENLKSISEDVQTIHLYKQQSFSSKVTHFKMQGDRQFLAIGDNAFQINEKMRIGSDGNKIWHYYKASSREGVFVCPFSDIDEKSIVIAEPFAPIGRCIGDVITARETDPNVIIEKMNLEYLGTEIYNNRKCHMIRSWSGEFWTQGKGTSCSIRTWWIDSETLLAVKVLDNDGRSIIIRQINYYDINHPIDISEFQFDRLTKIPTEPFEPLGEGFDTRFLKIHDGSHGYQTIWCGKKGPGGTPGSGFF